MNKKHLSKEYLEYMKSPVWRELSDTILARDDYRCTKCGHKGQLQAHHLTYERLFDEDINDLVTLCKHCHEEAHGIRKPAQRVYTEIAKGVLVLKGDEPTHAQIKQAKKINNKHKIEMRRRYTKKKKRNQGAKV